MFSDILKHRPSNPAPINTMQLNHWQLLASSVAHDFNNLLTSILGQTSLALRQLPEEAEARPHIEKAIKAAEFAAALTDQLLSYSKGNYGVVDKVNLNLLIQDNLSLLDANFLNGIDIQLELSPTLPLIQVESGQIQQVIMNLVINAAEAIQPGSGNITIRTGTQTLTDDGYGYRSANGRSRLSGNYIYLQVQDDGIGMDPATLNHIFDPFFTTKLTGRGLGLPAIQEIINTHHGTIAVKSQIGHGTTFTVYLPIQSNPNNFPLQ